MPRVIHFEIPADDPARARKFYEGVFGWSFQKWEGPSDYWLVRTGEEAEPGIDGGLAPRQGPGGTVNVVDVESVDATSRAVEKAGGQTVVPKMAVPGIGWVAYYQDTEGNTIGVLESDASAA
ncbi:MAG: VOC family protein [Gemmatimonadetes bacterium]|uniref:VOC family protein n=1 Tax=Candidatus Kutchimonas denitrificans TaxID=3056748 RepID=A0AAE4Z8L4_9BACT|nr:VOC family protein [Gemmatimonadota bacterium]NIR75834.1 VOC family protein [Candidatus Kutchimonas denitrificans]NIS02001.1 VOC family protein [Gemmatimonadota bacterium]NIT67805.1 VOC family protein [Gemmatimonadota bacterium]NIU53792.1 VOC family protein [Gemmatimonadota bacterium]